MSILFACDRPPFRLCVRALGGITGAALYLLCITCAVAQSSGGAFAITKQSVAGGGGPIQGVPYVAVVTTGQATAGTQSGGGFRLIGGFHAPAVNVAAADPVFKDDFEL
jgi:hypothetical protein